MKNCILKSEEIILLKESVTLENIKPNVQLTLTNERMIFEQEKGLFHKKLKVMDIISIDDIKIYKEKVQIKQKKKMIMMQTIDKNITFSCMNTFVAAKIMNEIIHLKTGSNLLERGKGKIKKAMNVVNDTKDIVIAIGGIIATIGAFMHRKKK